MFMTKLKTPNENRVSLKKKTQVELQELLERQNKILSNRRFVDGLPDKGQKVIDFREQLEVELKSRRMADEMSQVMSSLNIGKDQLDTLEWTGKHGPCVVPKNNDFDVDRDDGDILKMFVSHSGVNQDKIMIREKPEEPLIKPSDLVDEDPVVKCEQQHDESEQFQENVERYAKNLCGRIDTHLSDKRKPILLNKPAKPNIHSTVKSATVSLKESVTLQLLHEKKLKEIQAERLVQRAIEKVDTTSYREVNPVGCDFDILDSDSESSDSDSSNSGD